MIRRGEGVAEVVGLRHEDVVGPAHPFAQRGRSRARRRCAAIGGPPSAQADDRQLVQRASRRRGRRRPRPRGPSSGSPNRARRLVAVGAEVGARDRAADDLVPWARRTRDLVGEEDASGERRREAVREAEMGVGLGERGRNPAQPAPPAPSGRRRSLPLRARRRAGAGRGSRRQAKGAVTARQSARSSASPGLRGRPQIANVSSSKPASGTSRDSTRSATRRTSRSRRARAAPPRLRVRA